MVSVYFTTGIKGREAKWLGKRHSEADPGTGVNRLTRFAPDTYVTVCSWTTGYGPGDSPFWRWICSRGLFRRGDGARVGAVERGNALVPSDAVWFGVIRPGLGPPG